MAGKLTVREVSRTDDGPALGSGPVERWRVDGLPPGESADLALLDGHWRIMRVRGGQLETDGETYPTAESAFRALVEEYEGRV